MKELSMKEKSKRYEEALDEANVVYKTIRKDLKPVIEQIFPELKESEDEIVRKNLIELFHDTVSNDEIFSDYGLDKTKVLAWLEKQGKETSWKPSKEEMDVLYGLAYITNQYDEHKEEVITRLYQDLKREFFNGASYENMFPTHSIQDDVRRRSTIQVLEYARSLDTYNQYGKADIDKNIAWLEKQGEQKPAEWHIEDEQNLNACLGYIPDELLRRWLKDAIHAKYDKPINKVEAKFHEGDWVVTDKGDTVQIGTVNNDYYTIGNGMLFGMPYVDTCWHSWTIQDAKDGDVLVYGDNPNGHHVEVIMIFKSLRSKLSAFTHFHIFNNEFRTDNWCDCGKNAHPASKEQRSLLFQKMKVYGYEWNADKKELKKL